MLGKWLLVVINQMAMRSQQYDTELRLRSAMPKSAQFKFYAAGLISALYLLRYALFDIPPQDHVALSLIICCLLTSAWSSLDQTLVTISLAHNRCWMQRRRLGSSTRQSIPVSQIHSAKPELSPELDDPRTEANARVVLITSLGMIPICESYSHDPDSTEAACEHINRFLASEADFMAA